MNLGRVESLLANNSPLGAVYNGEPVWIKSINKENQTAVVQIPAFAEPEKNVPVGQLKEI